MRYLRQAMAVLGKDLRTELRSRDLMATMVFLAVLCVVLFRFAFDFVPTSPGERRADAFLPLGAGLLWVAIVFCSLLGLDRSFALEKEEGGLEGLILAPIDRTALLFGKTMATSLVVCVMEGLILASMALFYGVSFFPQLGRLVLVLGVNTFGFLLVGTVVSFLAGGSRRGGLLLPVLQIPLTLPLLILAVRATAELVRGGETGAAMDSLRLSAVLTAVYLGISLMVFDALLEES